MARNGIDRTVTLMKVNTNDYVELFVLQDQAKVSVRDAISDVWSGLRSADDFTIELSSSVPQLNVYLSPQDLADSNPQPRDLLSQRPTRSEV